MEFGVIDVWDNGEFLSGATLVLTEDGEEVHREEFVGSLEFPGGATGMDMAVSAGLAACEVHNVGLEELLAPFGIEYQREREEVPF